jgi:hypothetical protein
MKAFLIISLFILISSKDNAIEFAKEIPFDNNNAKFEFTYDKNDNIFIKVTTNDRCKMNFDAIIHSYATDISKPGTSVITQKELVSSSYKIEFEPDKYGPKTFNGTFWINPSLLEVKIDINSKVEWNYFTFTARDERPKLTYSLDNAEKDVTFIFKYSYDNKKDITSPFEVCHGNDCKDQITTYDFKKGESYKIYAKHIQVDNIWVFPSFSFLDKAKDSNSFNLAFNLWLICLLLFIL